MYNLPSVILLLISVECIHICRAEGNKTHDWDMLIFTQHWPLTVCLKWKESLPQHSCILPSTKNIWTVHGIWPSKLGTKGPEFCNSSLHFNQTQLEPIKEQLEQYWTNIYNGSIYSLWKHEWKKHGTCAAALPALDNEDKYFGQGLKWINEYGMSNILGKSGIEPKSQGYTSQDIWNTVQKSLGKNPTVQCIFDPKTKQTYLSEIRICFDKNLTLIDCDGLNGPSDQTAGIKTNCPLKKTIIYPSTIPSDYEKPFYIITSPMYEQHSWLLEALQIIQFLQWMTF